MEVIAGFPIELLPIACSRLKEQGLIFGLPAGGIGVLNPANMARCTVHPDPVGEPAKVWTTREVNGSKSGRLVKNWRVSTEDSSPLSRLPPDSWITFSPTRKKSK